MPDHEGLVRQVRALFQQRVAGDDALLELARLRFEQAGLGAELHAGDIDTLEWTLAYAPAGAGLPTVHLDRGLDLLSDADRATVTTFVQHFDGRVAGFVVHDKKHMARRTDELVSALRGFDRGVAGCRPTVFLEYAAGHDPAWFAELGRRLADVASVGMCIDIGHVGIRQAQRMLAYSHPGVEFRSLQTDDELLGRYVEGVQRAAASALPTVLSLTRALSQTGKPLHFHLHDGHPLIPGLSDHFSFLTRVPLPFAYQGRRSLDTMYGPDGLRTIVDTAVAAAPSAPPTFVFEIHQADGRRPLADAAADLFAHWTNLTNAERANHWLAVLAENARLL